jgi:hypothetical protein
MVVEQTLFSLMLAWSRIERNKSQFQRLAMVRQRAATCVGAAGLEIDVVGRLSQRAKEGESSGERGLLLSPKGWLGDLV